MKRPFFRVYELLIRDILTKAVDVPAQEEEFVALLREHGLNFPGLKDPSGRPYRAVIDTFGSSRVIRVETSAPDNNDTVAWFQGRYFTRESAAIAKAAMGASAPAQNA